MESGSPGTSLGRSPRGVMSRRGWASLGRVEPSTVRRDVIHRARNPGERAGPGPRRRCTRVPSAIWPGRWKENGGRSSARRGFPRGHDASPSQPARRRAPASAGGRARRGSHPETRARSRDPWTRCGPSASRSRQRSEAQEAWPASLRMQTRPMISSSVSPRLCSLRVEPDPRHGCLGIHAVSRRRTRRGREHARGVRSNETVVDADPRLRRDLPDLHCGPPDGSLDSGPESRLYGGDGLPPRDFPGSYRGFTRAPPLHLLARGRAR